MPEEHPILKFLDAIKALAEGRTEPDAWLEADGDQVLFDLRQPHNDDPPVFYYALEAVMPKVRQLALSFTEWVESLPRSRMFK